MLQPEPSQNPFRQIRTPLIPKDPMWVEKRLAMLRLSLRSSCFSPAAIASHLSEISDTGVGSGEETDGPATLM